MSSEYNMILHKTSLPKKTQVLVLPSKEKAGAVSTQLSQESEKLR
jgi:hypothetical protein